MTSGEVSSGECGQEGGGSREPLRGKLAALYTRLLVRGEELSEREWSELFLLWVSVPKILHLFDSLPQERIGQLRPRLRDLCGRCIGVGEAGQGLPTLNALQTLACLLRTGTPKALAAGLDPSDVLLGPPPAAANLLRRLTARLAQLIGEEGTPGPLELASLRCLLSLVVATPELQANPFLAAALTEPLFEALLRVLGNAEKRGRGGKEALIALTLISQHRRHSEESSSNPFAANLSLLDDELVLSGYSQVICAGLSVWNWGFQRELGAADAKTGLMSGLANALGSLFVAEEPGLGPVPSDEGLLLALYQAVHLNRNFFTTLTTLPPASPITPAAESPPPTPTEPSPALPNTNLLAAFLTYASVLLQHEPQRKAAGQLAMIALTCLAEDDYALNLMHDPNMAFRVPLYRPPRRHRKGALDSAPPLRPLAATLLDLLREFLHSHMARALPVHLYEWSLGVLHRILCYQRRARVRLAHSWRELWDSLAALLKFLTAQEDVLDLGDLFRLATATLRIFNLFITFGDTFLPSPAHYDLLYYELIRNADAMENLSAMALRHADDGGGGGAEAEAAGRLLHQAANIRAILAHFRPSLTAMAAEAPLTEDQVLKLVRANYASLTLRLYQSLDVFQRYDERSAQAKAFFPPLVDAVVAEWRELLDVADLNRLAVLPQLSTIT